MKKIIALLRNECAEQSKSALEKRGIHSVIVLPVRAKVRHYHPVSDSESSLHSGNEGCLTQNSESNGENSHHAADPERIEQEYGQEFFPRTMFVIVVCDEVVHDVVHELIEVNQRGDQDEGKIFICPMVSAIEIGNGECGDGALS